MKTFADTLWTLVRWALPITVAGVIAAAAIGSSRIGEEIRRRVELRLEAEFPSLEPRVQSAQVVEGEGIVIRGISIVDPRLPQAIRTLMWIEEVRIACGTSIADLASGNLRIAEVRVRRPTVHAVRIEGGGWTFERLLAGHAGTSPPPPLLIEDATLHLDDTTIGARGTIRRLHAEVSPDATAGGVVVRGTFAGDLIAAGRFEGRFGLSDGGFDLTGRVDSLDIAEPLVSMLPAIQKAPSGVGDWLRGFRGRSHFDWRIQGNRESLSSADFEIAGKIESARYEHATLPFAIADISAEFRADRSGGQIRNLQAHSGPTLLKGGGRWNRWDLATDFELEVEAERLLVGRHWEPLLPESAAVHWRKLLPAGEVDVRAHLVRTASRIEPKVSLRCRSVSITHYRFPYRLDRTVGTVVLDGASLSMHLTGQAGGHPVHVDGMFENPGANAKGFLEVRADGMGIDEGLLAAMPVRSADIVRSLRAAGTFGFVFRHDRSPDLPGGHSNSLGIRLARCSMAYVGFPYPLSGVSGTVHMRDGKWTIRDVSGFNDSGEVRCSGELEPADEGDGELVLRFTGSRMVLEDELRDSLPGGMRRIWNEVDPRGLVDVQATVRHRVKARSTEVEMQASPHGETVSIEPAWFPYRLERLAGRLLWERGVLRFEGVRGVHGRTTVATEGSCRFQPDGAWHVSFQKLSADRFRAENEVLEALPEGLQQAVQSMRPRGLMSLAGSLEVFSNPPVAEPSPPDRNADSKAGPSAAATTGRAGRVSATWDMHVDVEQGTLDVGVPLEHVHGGVHLVGQSDGSRWQSHGELAIDSLIWRGVQMTSLEGPLAIDAEGVRFGTAASQADLNRGRRLSARVAGGAMQADGVVSSGDSGRFRIAATLGDSDLARLAGESLGTSHRYRGRVHGAIDLSGSRAGTHSFSGKGELRLRNADIYELPLVLAMLKMLRVKPPDRNAFGSSFVEFRVEGPRAYLDTIELSGDAISLVGNGELDLDGKVHMTFRSIMGDSETQLPVMKRMLGGASGQFMLIHVDGTLADPEMNSEAFPTLNAAIQKLQTQRSDRRASRGLDENPARTQ